MTMKATLFVLSVLGLVSTSLAQTVTATLTFGTKGNSYLLSNYQACGNLGMSSSVTPTANGHVSLPSCNLACAQAGYTVVSDSSKTGTGSNAFWAVRSVTSLYSGSSCRCFTPSQNSAAYPAPTSYSFFTESGWPTTCSSTQICDSSAGAWSYDNAGNITLLWSPVDSTGSTWGTFCSANYVVTSGTMFGITPPASPPPSPSPPPPSPPPPSPAISPSATAYVSAALTVSGYSTSTFGTAQASAFASAIATGLSVSASAITITSVTAAASSGRRLTQTGVTVAFSVQTTGSASSALVSSISTLTNTVTASSLQAAGLTACTGISIASQGSVGTTTPTATTALPNTGSCNTAACSGCTSCAAAQTCANTYYCSGTQSVTNFQCSTVNGVGSWSATCASSTPTTSSATLVKSAAGIIAATAAAMFI